MRTQDFAQIAQVADVLENADFPTFAEQLNELVSAQVFFEDAGVGAAAEMAWEALREQIVDLVNLSTDLARHGGPDEGLLDEVSCARLVAILDTEDAAATAA